MTMYKNITAKFNEKKLKRLAELHGSRGVKVGILRGAGVHPGPTKITKKERAGKGSSGSSRTATIAEIAWWNEFGTSIRFGRSGGARIVIPERPFLRWTMREHDYYREEMEIALKKALMSSGWAHNQILHFIGLKASSDIRRMITIGPFVPNAPETIRKKSTSSGVKAQPLIDTGTLRKSINYELVKGRLSD